MREQLAAIDPDMPVSLEQRRATPLFTFNPEYLDPALPPTAIQLITGSAWWACAVVANLNRDERGRAALDPHTSDV